MINNILLPTDFSEVANNALRYAIELCKKTESKLHLFHIKSIPVMDASFPAETYQLILQEMEEATKVGFEKLETAYLKSSGITFELHSMVAVLLTFHRSLLQAGTNLLLYHDLSY
jgi:nucleotide-binding universal stress UspA family protein